MSITKSSGNVFADLGHPHSEEALAKAQLVFRISSVIENYNLNLKDAASLLDLTQSELSSLLDGLFDEFTIDRLTHYLTTLDEAITARSIQKPAQSNARHTKGTSPRYKILRVIHVNSFLSVW
jgi:predicted XRE-type DNA-binding protein